MSFFAFKKILLATSAICGLSFVSTANAAIEVGTWEDFKNAITSGTETDIILTGDIIADTADSLIPNRDINISGNGSNKFTISAKEGLTFNGALLKNSSGKYLTLSNVELNGFNNISNFASGGAIDNYTVGTISSITDSTFTGNSAGFQGGAISSNGKISSITGSIFTGNSASHYGGAIFTSGTISSIIGSTFTGNTASYGGAISNGTGSTISNIIGSTFTGNTASNSGGAIYNYQGTISSIIGSTFTGNTAQYGGAIYNDNTIGTLSATFENNKANKNGGAIYNDSRGTIGTLSATFENNKANETSYGGGAIYNWGRINLVADAADSTDNLLDEVLVKGNIAVSGKGNGIYNRKTLTFTANNNGAFTFYDDIYNYDNSSVVNFAGDGTGKFNLFNDIGGIGTLNFNASYAFNMINDTINVIQAGSLTINSVLNMAVDVDLANATMDHFDVTNIAFGENGKIIVNGMKLLSDMADGTTETEINFISPTDNVSTPLESAILEADSLMNRYKVRYDSSTGNFVFNIYVPKTPVEVAEDVGVPAVSAGVQQMQTSLNSLLANRDIYLNMGLASGDTTRPITWAKAFGSKDNVELKNSYNSIDTQFYGVVGGVDSRTFIYDNGINAVYGIYAAYMGSNQKQNSVKVTQDGGYLGVSADFTRNGVFSRFTAHGGYIANEAKTAWGNDKFDIWTASVSNKTGYEIDLGEYTLKPALYASYMYINTENYTSKAGAKLKNHTKNVFEVTPEVKLAKDFGAGLEGYAKVAYTWNFYQGGKVTADDVLLPKMSVKPYVEYGVGLEKDWSEEEWNPKDITSYAEINRHDGGRTGWDINAGLKFQF